MNASVRQRKYTAIDTLRERKFQGTKVQWNDRTFVTGSKKAGERKGQGVNWPGSYWPIRSGERMGPGAKRLGTHSSRVGGVSRVSLFISKTKFIHNKPVCSTILGCFSYQKNSCKHTVLFDVNKKWKCTNHEH